MKLRLLVLVACALGSACGDRSDSQEKDARDTEQRQQELRAQVGMPAVTNFTEAKFAKQITELRDQEIRTWTYYLDIQGQRHLLCESVGYGLPYSVQFTNPEHIAYEGSWGVLSLPQPEPNGLYMPQSADATWVLCSDGKGGIAPVYSEPHLLVSPFPLGHVDATESSGFADTVSIQRVTPRR